MANELTVSLPISRQDGQRSVSYSDAYISRYVPTWNQPSFSANAWRAFVAAQPVAVICRETLIANLLALDWKIEPRDPNLRQELSATIRYYTRLLERTGYGMDLDFTSHVEWTASDLLDTPFGAGSEIGRKEDKENGRVQWVKPLDAATLYPTMNFDYPVVQSYLGQVVPFPRYAFARTFMSPLKVIEKEGWGMAPPEKIFTAINMVSQGDGYYANLLLDIPTVGILDLGDMEQNAAKSWVEEYKNFLVNGGKGSFKIPVLYEHNNDVKFLSLGKVPNDIMYDRITLRYASFVCGGYGVTLSDIGIPMSTGGGDTLAGSIRSERKTKRTGFARLKRKLKYYFDQILPPTLEFQWIDLDDELSVALGRARLANATAWGQMIDKNIFTAKEARAQTIADGLITIAVSEDPEIVPTQPATTSPERPGMLGPSIAPSQGGWGEIRSYQEPDKFKNIVRKMVRDTAKVFRPIFESLQDLYGEDEDNLFVPRKLVEKAAFDNTGLDFESLFTKIDGSKLNNPELEKIIKRFVVIELSNNLFKDDDIDTDNSPSYDSLVDTLQESVFESIQDFLNSEKGKENG